MTRRRLLNLGLGVLVIAVAVVGIVVLVSPSQSANTAAPTTRVARGLLEATVTASGNVESGVTASLQMPGTGGVVDRVFVKSGQKVELGDRLVAVDDTTAQLQLDSAQATLKSAEGAMINATQGRTSKEKQSDAAAIAAANQALKNAERTLASAKETYEQDMKQQGATVDSAQAKLEAARQQQAQHQADLVQAQQALAAADPADTALIAELNATISALQAQLPSDAAGLASAQAALLTAEQTRDRVLLQDRHAITSQAGIRDSAKKTLASQKAAVAVGQQGAKPGTRQSAQAQIDSARVALDQAHTAIENTVLRAPFDGVISTVSAVEGEQSNGAGAGGASATSSGLITLVNPTQKTVNASIAEADATSVKSGQSVAINLPASGVDMAGRVVTVDVQSTVTNNVVQYLTTVALNDPDDSVRVGQTASITITTGSLDDVLYVPTSAILHEGDQTYVIKVTDGTQTRVSVETGLAGTNGTQIVTGLAEGDEVLLTMTGATGNGLLPTTASSPR